MRAAGAVLALAGAIGGFVVAFGVWGVGYCGGLTPDVPAPGTLRSDLCRGTSGDVMGGGVFASWLLAAVAPIVGAYWALRRDRAWPLVVAAATGAAPIVTIAILAETLPDG